jgi:hypothetical protein
MPDLLETIADKTALHLMDLTAAVRDDVHRRKGVRDPELLKIDLSAGRFLNRECSRIVEVVEEWRVLSEARLREGTNGHRLRVLARSGARLVRGFLAVAEVAAQLWDHLERSGAADEAAGAREQLAASTGRVLAVKPWFDRLERLAEAHPPDIDPALIEQGAEAIRQGRFKTTAQIRESLRGTTP